jgi:F-type H+-transporting ATPase subunit a
MALTSVTQGHATRLAGGGWAKGRGMARRMAALIGVVGALASTPAPAAAQAAPACFGQTPVAEAEGAERGPVDIITPHITDSHELDLPYIHSPFFCIYQLHRWEPVRIGPLTLDLSPTKHVVWMTIAALLCLATLLPAAAFHRRHLADPATPRGFAAGMEALVLYLRQSVVLPNVGPHGDAYTPYILSIFFFVLFANLVGLIPYGSTATGNISVTLTMAIISFVVIEISGMRALGRDYWKTIVYWDHDLPIGGRIAMSVLMTPIEILSKLTKPFALTIRLFANMTAGHVVMLALISLIFAFGSIFVAVVPVGMAVADSLLEIFVAFLQAFIFALLTAVFIGQIRQSAH